MIPHQDVNAIATFITASRTWSVGRSLVVLLSLILYQPGIRHWVIGTYRGTGGWALVRAVVAFTAAGGVQSRIGRLRENLVRALVQGGLFGSPVSPVSASLFKGDSPGSLGEFGSTSYCHFLYPT